MKIITSPRLFIYEFDPAHTEMLVDWLPTKRAVAEFGGVHLTHPITTEQLFSPPSTEAAPAGRRVYSASSRELGMLVGHGALFGIDDKAKHCRLAHVLIAPMFRGEGLGRELVALLCTAAFDILRMDSVSLRVFEHNEAAVACYGGVGFLPSAEAPVERRFGRQRWMMHSMTLERDRWLKLRPEWAVAAREGDDCCSH